ncbi:uncharacterized protein V6R79_016609 [Siganus canaliculatus]
MQKASACQRYETTEYQLPVSPGRLPVCVSALLVPGRDGASGEVPPDRSGFPSAAAAAAAAVVVVVVVVHDHQDVLTTNVFGILENNSAV